MSVTSIVSASNSSDQWDVKQCLKEAIRDIEAGDLDADACMLVFINHDAELPGGFDISHYKAQLDTASAVVLLRCTEKTLLDDLGF